ncbi:hypothetical protein [Streptomyces sp. SCL15-4]|uniref:hypothetical protein n=1 Tax=Streptomyces sp. SCL15-4 TaxID=2967221 RepID=UPI0029663EA8|nr:hypothetical protein [Streptomyces sp. SCL15-4]
MAKPSRRTDTVVHRDGRDPLPLGAAITLMLTERGMAVPAAGGSVPAQFDDILAAAAPELAGHVQAVKSDADTGRLDVAPDAPACGTELRWSAPKLIAVANETVPGANVRALHVLPSAPGKVGPALPVPRLAARLPPREQCVPAGAAVPGARAITPAVKRQTAAMRAHGRRVDTAAAGREATAAVSTVRGTAAVFRHGRRCGVTGTRRHC